MATATVQRAKPVQTPITSVTLVMSEEEARALVVVAGARSGKLSTLRLKNIAIYEVTRAVRLELDGD